MYLGYEESLLLGKISSHFATKLTTGRFQANYMYKRKSAIFTTVDQIRNDHLKITSTFKVLNLWKRIPWMHLWTSISKRFCAHMESLNCFTPVNVKIFRTTLLKSRSPLASDELTNKGKIFPIALSTMEITSNTYQWIQNRSGPYLRRPTWNPLIISSWIYLNEPRAQRTSAL